MVKSVALESTKQLIIKSLGKEYPLTLKQVHDRLRPYRNVSYQAIAKALGELCRDEIILKVEKQYMLDKAWVQRNVDDFSLYYNNYFHTVYHPNQINVNTKIQVFRFNSVKEIINFIVEAYNSGKLDQSGDGTLYASVKRLPPFLPEAFTPLIKKIAKEHNAYIACRGSSAAQRWVARYYKSLGAKIILGAETKHYNSICIGDCAIQYFWFMDDSYRDRLYAQFEKVVKSSLNLVKLTSELLYRRTHIVLIINRHSVLVDDISATVLSQFKK